MRRDPHKIYCFDRITKVSEFQHELKRVLTEIKTIDCDLLFPDSETEKAWKFDYTKLYEEQECSRRFYYAPKSQCKVLKNDYYINEDGTLVTDRKFILAPWWLAVEIGA